MRYAGLRPAVSLDERNAAGAPGSGDSSQLHFRFEDRIDDQLFNCFLWKAIRGTGMPYPAATRQSAPDCDDTRPGGVDSGPGVR